MSRGASPGVAAAWPDMGIVIAAIPVIGTALLPKVLCQRASLRAG